MTSRYLPKNGKKELETPIQTIRIYSQDIGMEPSIEKGVMMIMRSGKEKQRKEKNCQIMIAIMIIQAEKIKDNDERNTLVY